MHHYQINTNRYNPQTQTLQIRKSYVRLPFIKHIFKDSTQCSTWLRPPVTWNVVFNTYATQIRLALAYWKANFKAHLLTKSQDLQLNQ
jgi:hypothetical protein